MLAPLMTLLQQPVPANTGGLAAHRRLGLIATVTAAALIINHYLAVNGQLEQGLRLVASLSSDNADALLHDWSRALRRSQWYGLYQYLWWCGSLLVGYVVLPMLALRFVLREPIMDSGLRLGDTWQHRHYYLVFGGVMATMAVLASFNKTFLHTYPFYAHTSRSLADLLMWECIYVLQFFCIEYFYRGFLLRGLQPQFGVYSIYISSLVYLTIHLPKPFLECVGSLFFGLILCTLAMLCRSIWGGVFVHVCLAVSMDVLSLAQTGRWPTQWWP